LKGLLKSQNTVLQICFGLFSHSKEFVQLCYKYDIDVALCSSGAICAAVCSEFSHVVFSHNCSFSKSVFLLSILTMCFLPSSAVSRHFIR